ncbi:MAG TPA: DUF2950 family protein [Rubrivivax sp.]|nr:DUF2950 family protein [Rubrivivax sp.]
MAVEVWRDRRNDLRRQPGVDYEKDLGPDTEALAKAMTRFDPGPGWIRFDAAQ